jgi:hypothetical protein
MMFKPDTVEITLIETEPSLTQEVAIFLYGRLLPSGHEHQDYVRELSGRGRISFG